MLRKTLVILCSILFSFYAMALDLEGFTECQGENYGPYIKIYMEALENSSSFNPSFSLVVLDHLKNKMEGSFLLNLESMKSCKEAYDFLNSHEKKIVEILNSIENFAKE